VTSTPITPAAKALKKWIAANSSQTAVANALGVRQPSVFAWLKGSARPEAHLRGAIQELTGINPADWELKEERAKRDKALKGVRETKGAA
jgi:hypothetical protein